VFAALQINLVSFAAPIATLTMMESRGASDRHLAATLAMVMAMAQANVSFPMAAMGLSLRPGAAAVAGGRLAAAAITYHGFGRQLSATKASSTRPCSTASPTMPRACSTSSTAPAPRPSRFP
jgi:hypothetical protein